MPKKKSGMIIQIGYSKTNESKIQSKPKIIKKIEHKVEVIKEEPTSVIHINKNGFCLGNGLSRQGLDVSTLKLYGKVYACNGYYREEIKPDILVSVNKKMIEEVKRNYNGKFAYLDSRPGSCEKRIMIDGQPYKDCPGWASGPVSVLLMCNLENPERIFLIGHDLYSEDDKVNNIYAGTSNYVDKNHPTIPCCNWIKQLKEIFLDNTDIKFYRVVKVIDEVMEWINVPNVKIITFEEMLELLRG